MPGQIVGPGEKSQPMLNRVLKQTIAEIAPSRRGVGTRLAPSDRSSAWLRVPGGLRSKFNFLPIHPSPGRTGGGWLRVPASARALTSFSEPLNGNFSTLMIGSRTRTLNASR
jgi:hypothetical protein